jgi:hypothetical protein
MSSSKRQNNQAERSNEQVTLERDDFVPDHSSGKDDSEYQDQLSVMVSPDQGFDISCPIPLDCNYGHGDGPTTSKSLDPVHNTNNVDEATIPQSEASGKALPHDSEPEKVQLFNPTAESAGWNPSEGFKEFLNTNFRRNLSSSQIFTILGETALPDMEVFLTPKLDKSLADQISPSYKKTAENRDKELSKVQRHVLNAAAPLRASTDKTVSC